VADDFQHVHAVAAVSAFGKKEIGSGASSHRSAPDENENEYYAHPNDDHGPAPTGRCRARSAASPLPQGHVRAREVYPIAARVLPLRASLGATDNQRLENRGMNKRFEPFRSDTISPSPYANPSHRDFGKKDEE
jgi:hypothetical protein